jgi:hypothetical protein
MDLEMKKETPETLKPYEFHSLEFSINGTEAKSDCPSCGAVNKLFISKKTGQYDCKLCGNSGNKYTFMTEIHSNLLSSTSDQDYKRIKKLRGNLFPEDFLKKHELCLDENDQVVVPIKVPGNENLSNLRSWNPKNKVFYNTPTCCSLYFESWSKEGPVYICEGEWDALSLRYLMIRAKHKEKCSIVAVPGANTFKDGWTKHFQGRDVVLLYDNDHDKQRPTGGTFNPGKDGMEMVSKKLTGIANSISKINWEKIDHVELTDGFDIRDYLGEAKKSKKSKLYLKRLLKACEASSSKSKHFVKTLKRTSFEQVIKDWKEVYEFNQSFEDVLACCFATLISLYLTDKRNPLWLFIVAPPSSGKTTIIEGFKAAVDYTVYLSELTPASLVTGLKFDEGGDPSLLNRGNEKVWFIEDFTPILNMPGRDEVFGIFRAAYNGFYTAHFATHHKEYEDLHFAVVSGVTHAIERMELGDFGERFLRIRLIDDDFNEDLHIDRALQNVGIRDEQKHLLLGGINGFIEHLMKNKKEPIYNNDMNHKLKNLAKFTALMRTGVHRNKAGLATRPIPEVGSRIATQLKKLGIALGCVYNRDSVDNDCYRVMQKVAFDTCVGWTFEIVQTLSKSEEGLTIQEIAQIMNVHVNQVRKIAEDAMQLGVLTMERISNGSGRRGNKKIRYCLTDRLINIMREAEIVFGDHKRQTSSNRTKRSRRKRYGSAKER